MSQLRARALILCLSLALLAGAIFNGISVSAGGPELGLPPATLLIAVIAGALALYFGSQVAKFQDRDRRSQVPNMTPIFAARVAIFAQACALSGALIAGWHVAITGFQLTLLSARGSWEPVLFAVLGIVTGIILLVCGLIAENMCKIPPHDGDDASGPGTPAPRTDTGYARNDSSRP
ncbi:DUF3180 domain-containing protein [Rothia terrae]|uniref:DUF3180 domain-containing protein n=1 Tax=Rothia terrae TaxID=396015 RepID=UPI0028813E7C|nr:DUF3180 domain-containing protein [Rothia terrae]MDT0189389.1 DUF3180 domain-containing protein [Rothia terrae]